MPFASEKQRRYLWANEPEVAREFADKETAYRYVRMKKKAKKKKAVTNRRRSHGR
jgi:hypothetical protein